MFADAAAGAGGMGGMPGMPGMGGMGGMGGAMPEMTPEMQKQMASMMKDPEMKKMVSCTMLSDLP
jgi:hypothetical protein